MKAYIDASVIIRRILEQPGAVKDWTQFEGLFASELIRLEIFRSIHRWNWRKMIGDAEMPRIIERSQEHLETMTLLPITPYILSAAQSYVGTPLGALDAIHLATALHLYETLQEELVFLTHDIALSVAATISGFEVRPPRPP